MGRRITFLALILSALLNIYLFKVTSVKSAEEQTDSNPVFTVVGDTRPQIKQPTNIAACEFYRGNWNPPAQKYQSPILIGYFEEASKLSGIPASVLAGITRVETPTLVGLTDQTLSSYSCPENVDGALGPMQIVSHFSHRTDAICRDCIEVGAKLLGKTTDQLTKEDYCGLRSGMILGAGFVLKKMQYNFNITTPTWDPFWTTNKDVIYKLANSFYGSLNYPSSSGPYNYGEDVWNSVSNCKPAPRDDDTSTGPSPLGNAAKDLVAAFKKHCGSSPVITSSYHDCIENNFPASITYPDKAYIEVEKSSGYGYYQCVGLVSTVAAGVLGEGIIVGGSGGGYAGFVAEQKGLTSPQGVYDWIDKNAGVTIQPGDFVVWASNPGHMAVVTEVYPNDPGAYEVAEANAGESGLVRTSTRTVAEIGGWLRKK